jgi:hypothetical protein
MNHGMKWLNYANVIDINVNDDWAIVKWESTSKNDRSCVIAQSMKSTMLVRENKNQQNSIWTNPLKSI